MAPCGLLPSLKLTPCRSFPDVVFWDDAAVQKFAELLNELYENGDMDVRSIITMVVLMAWIPT